MRLFAWLKKRSASTPIPGDTPAGPPQSLRQGAVAGLYSVIDPEVGVNIVDLGLVYHIEIEADSIGVQLTTTAPVCPMGEFLRQQAQQAVAARTDRPTHVELVLTPSWTPAMMSAAARRQLSGQSG